MNEPAQSKQATESNSDQQDNGYTAGIVLVLIGAVALVSPYVDLGLLLFAGLGLTFLVWGVVKREVGLIIPGGILSGIGAGVLATAWLGSDYQNFRDIGAAVYLLCFAGGWGLITLFSALFTDETHWWPLIPGGIMAVLGVSMLTGNAGKWLMQLLTQGWPLILIGLGVFLIARQWRRSRA